MKGKDPYIFYLVLAQAKRGKSTDARPPAMDERIPDSNNFFRVPV
jgi:hypothetical protein